MLKGDPAAPGIAIGKAFLLKKTNLPIPKRIDYPGREKEKFLAALETAREQIRAIKMLTGERMGKGKARIFEAHLLILEDLDLLKTVLSRIESKKESAAYALKSTLGDYGKLFKKSANFYLRERALDLEDVGNRLLRILTGTSGFSLPEIAAGSVLVTGVLTPSEMAQINKDQVLGLALDAGGQVSHSVIMARTMEIPMVVGLQSVTAQVQPGDLMIIDGNEGIVHLHPQPEVLEGYRAKQHAIGEFQKRLHYLKEAEPVTRDGRKVKLTANIGNPRDLRALFNNGAAGIGLFRTEFLYLHKNSLPTEAEQYEAYREVLEKMGEKPVVIRTFDLGGDKKTFNLPVKKELNPSLGYRALRLCLDHQDLFKTQLRAILRASVHGNPKIMFPLISSLQELREAKQVLAEVRNELEAERIPVRAEIPVGMMVEVPSAAIISDILAREVDFFSIGTNDLMQYTLAVDRLNEKIAYLYDPFNPAVLRLIKLVIDNGRREGKWVGMCGEMAGDIRFIPILLGFGLDEFSMASATILKVKQIIRGLDFQITKQIAEDVLNLATSDQIKDYIEQRLVARLTNQVI